jgi:hypothetical protein
MSQVVAGKSTMENLDDFPSYKPPLKKGINSEIPSGHAKWRFI